MVPLVCNTARALHHSCWPDSCSIRLWDVFILVPNLLFLGLLCILFQRARLKLYATNSPVFFSFYALTWIGVIFGVLRCVASMAMSSLQLNEETQDIANKALWTIVHFTLLTTEVSVLIFSLAFGRMESNRSIRAVLTTTGIISFVFSVVQGQYIHLASHTYKAHSSIDYEAPLKTVFVWDD